MPPLTKAPKQASVGVTTGNVFSPHEVTPEMRNDRRVQRRARVEEGIRVKREKAEASTDPETKDRLKRDAQALRRELRILDAQLYDDDEEDLS